MPGYNYAEGGGRFPPFSESFLERIVNVSWQSTGGVFVSGDYCCFERYVRMERADSAQRWIGLGSLAFTDGGQTFAGAYANVNGQPTFLLGGHGFNSSGRHGLIMVSNDGLNWATSIILPQQEDVIGLVWDSDAHEKNLAGQTTISGQGLFYADPDRDDGRCYYSPDGKSWFYAYGHFADYCKGVVPGVPDGVYGYLPSQDLLMFPGPYNDYTQVFMDYYGVEFPDNSTLFIVTDASTQNARVFYSSVGGRVQLEAGSGALGWGLSYVNCVTYCGGIWMVGGQVMFEDGNRFSGTAISIDNGFNWSLSTYGAIGMHYDYDPLTIVGGPIRDFK